jgi:hypothetical protein
MNSNPVPDFIQPKYKCFCGCLINYGSVKKHWKSEKHRIHCKARLYDEFHLNELNPCPETP